MHTYDHNAESRIIKLQNNLSTDEKGLTRLQIK